MANNYALQNVQKEILLQKSSNSLPSVLNISTALSSRPIYSPATVMRRGFFVWLKIFVHDFKDNEVVNVKIPLPIPLIGLLFRRTMSSKHALKLAGILKQHEHDEFKAWDMAGNFLDSIGGAEFIRVENKDEIVVISLE